MKLDKIKKICSEFGNDTSCSLSFNRIKPVESDDNTSESPETTDELNTIVEELPYVYTINTDLKNINIGFSKNINDADILDDNFEPGILTLAQLSHIIEPYSNDFNVIVNASNESEGGLNVDNLTNFSFNKEFLNHYLFSFLDNSVFIVGEVNKDRYFDEPNSLLILTKVYYANTFTNYSYDYGSEHIGIILPDKYNYDTHKNYNNAILVCNISFNSIDDLKPNYESKFDNISFDDIRIIRNRDNRDIFNELISLLFDINLAENSDILDYTFKHYNVKSIVDYLESVKYVIYEETLNTSEDTEIKVNKATVLYTETLETIKSDINNYQKQAEIDLTKLYNRKEFSDITTNILDGVVHKNFYTDIENDKSYYIDTQDSFKAHIDEVINGIITTINNINDNIFIPEFIEQRDTVLTSILDDTYDVGTIDEFCVKSASSEYNHDASAYYLIDTINYTVNYENGVRSSKMYFNMLNSDNLTDKLKLGNNIIYEYKNNTSGDSTYGNQLNFSPKNIGNKLNENKITHYFYDDMDFGTILLETKSDLPLENDVQSSKNNSLFIDNTDKLDEIYIPNCITTLGNDLFTDCEELSLLELPKYLTSIGENVFPNYDITIGYAKNPIDSRPWLNKKFTGTYNYYAPNFNGYNTLLFYPTFENNTVDITTIGFDDIDIVSIGKQSITLPNSGELNIVLDSTTEYIDDNAIKFEDATPSTLTITATNSSLWYFDISKYNTKFDNINMLLNSLSPVCLYYDKENPNHVYTYNNETFRDVQRNALSRLFTTTESENLDDLIELQDSSTKLSVTDIDDIHLISGCKLLNNEIRFIKRTNLTNDTISLVITKPDSPNYKYTGEYNFSSSVRISETLGNNTYYAVYTLDEESFRQCVLSKVPKPVKITEVFGSPAETLKTIYIKLNDDGFFVSSEFNYNAINEGSNGGITLTPVINGDFKVKTNNTGSSDDYELLHNFLDNTDLDIKQFTLSNDGVDYTDFKETLKSLNENCLNVESNFSKTGGLQYRTKADSKILDNINIFPLFFTTDSRYDGTIKMFLKTTDQLYSIQLSDIKTLSEIGISKLLLNDKFNPRLIEFPESINRFYDCPIIIDETYDTDELTLRFWSNFEDVITRKTLLDIDAIQRQIINVSVGGSVGVQVINSGISVSSPSNNTLSPSFGQSSGINNSFGYTQNNSFGSSQNNSFVFKQNNNVLCICTNSNSLEKLISINSEKLKTLRIQVKDGEEYEHIYNFFKTNINKLIQMNTSNNHVLNIVVEKFVHMNNNDSEVATYNFYDF